MTLAETLRQLYIQKERLDKIISELEELKNSRSSPLTKPPARRGRKSMGAEERLLVSRRMKRYWQNRRNEEGR
jgi:hypothetical protein